MTWLLRNPIWMLLAVIGIYFSFGSPHFLTSFNISNILFQSALVGLLAAGLTPVMISGNIDLSVGAIAGLAACLVIGMEPRGLGLSIVVALGSGLALGLLNGVIVEKTGVNSFIVTLGGMLGIRGLAFLYAGGDSLSPVDDTLTRIDELALGPFGVATMVFISCVVMLQLTLDHTRHGRSTYAIGGNRSAAADAGIPVSRHVIVNFAISGLLAAVCGIAMAANLGAATPSYGSDYELWAIIAVVLGGTRLRGGAGSLVGTFAAAITLATLRNGLALINVPPFYEPVIMGGVLVLALILDSRLTVRRVGSHE